MSATITRNVLGVVALLLCAACDPASSGDGASTAKGTTVGSGSATASGPTTTAAAKPPAKKKRKTTSASIAIHNLQDKIPQLEKQLALTPDDIGAMKPLTSLLMLRASKLGKISDLDRVVELAEHAVEVRPKDKHAYLMRASAYGAVHRFADALKDIDEAEKLGAEKVSADAARATSYIALARYDEGLALVQAARNKKESYETLFGEAMALGHMGRYAEADALYEKAFDAYAAISPYPLAQLDFERGAMWDRAGDEKKAETYYRAAVERLPQFAHAAGHLAYKLPHDEAVKLMQQLIESSDDPEYVGGLGFLMNKETPGSGDAWVDKAKPLYEELMKKHPLAFADHAGWFYVLIAKDYDKAIEAAEMNLQNRPTPEAFELMLAALVAAGQGTEACEIADRAVAQKYPTPGLKRRAASAYDLCGRADEAAELRATVETASAAKR